MNDYGYNLDRMMTVYRLVLVYVSFPYFINDTLSDIKGKFDVVIILYCIQDNCCLNLIV